MTVTILRTDGSIFFFINGCDSILLSRSVTVFTLDVLFLMIINEHYIVNMLSLIVSYQLFERNPW